MGHLCRTSGEHLPSGRFWGRRTELDTGDGKAVIGDGHVRAPGQVADDHVGDGEEHGARGQEETTVEKGEAEPDRAPEHSDAFEALPQSLACSSRHRQIRYPARGTVSMTCGSPSLVRNRLIVTFTTLVKGSAESSQTRSSISSAETVRPTEEEELEHTELLG